MEYTLGTLIKNHREKIGLQQKELAQLCDISRNCLFLIESEKTKQPALSILKQLYEKLDLPIDYFDFLALAGYRKPIATEKSFGETIYKFRLEQGISRPLLADLCYISRPTLASIESGKITKTSPELLKLLYKNLLIYEHLDFDDFLKLGGHSKKVKSWGNIIFQSRLRHGLTQQELCKLCNIDISELYLIETGSIKPKTLTLNSLSIALGFDLTKMRKNFPELKI